METLAEKPANAEQEAPVETGKVDSEPEETGSADPASAAAETGKPDTRDRVQERFDKLTREKYEGLSRAERAEYRAQLLEQQIAELKAAKPEPVAPAKPTLESCGWDESEFEKQLLAFNNRQSAASTASVSEAVKAQLAAEREAERQRQTDLEWERHESEFIKSKPDYTEKVLEGADRREWACSREMAETIKELRGVGPEVLYYLATNAAKSLEIARLPAGLQRVEIGRIAGRLEAAKTAPPPVSKAPPPAATLNSAEAARSVSTTDPASDKAMSDDEWYRAELTRVARKAARK
jgi:hypothetical protein